MERKTKATGGKHKPARRLDGKSLLARLMMLTAGTWAVTAAGIVVLLYCTAIPMYIQLSAINPYPTPALFLMAMSAVMIVFWLWGVAMSGRMRLRAMSVCGMAVFVISTFLSSGLDWELLNEIGVSTEVALRYGISRTYIYALLDIVGLGLFVLPTEMGGGLKVLFAIFPLTRFFDNVSVDVTAGGMYEMDKTLTFIVVGCAVKVVYALLLIFLAWRWQRGK